MVNYLSLKYISQWANFEKVRLKNNFFNFHIQGSSIGITKKNDSIETGCIVIAHLVPWSDLEKCIYDRHFN